MGQHHDRRKQGCEYCFQQHRAQQAARAAMHAHRRRITQHNAQRQQLGRIEQDHRGPGQLQQRGMIDRVCRRAIRHQAESRNHQHQQPQRRRQIRHKAHRHVQAAGHADALCDQDAGVLHIALRPAAVALEIIIDGRRRLFERAAQIGRHPHIPAGAAQKSGFDKIMAHDLAAERRLAGKFGQSAMLQKGAHADDGIVAPIISVRPLQGGKPRRKSGAIDRSGKLLDAREQRMATDQLGRGLDQAGPGIGVHQPRQRAKRFAGHQAVGVQHHHIIVQRPPILAKVLDVAALAPDIAVAMAIENFRVRRERSAQLLPRDFFGDPVLRIGGIAQDVEIESLLAGIAHRIVNRPYAGEDLRHILVIDRHQDGGAALGFAFAALCRG